MAKEITLTFDLEKGTVEADLDNFHGKGCAAVIEGFAEAAGASTAGMVKKHEYNAPILGQNRLKQR
jgi:hypothetical protein